MSITTETARVYRGGGRRYLTLRAAVYAEAVAIIKRKHPSERSETDDQGRCTYPGWHWSALPRHDVLLRRMCRLVRAVYDARHAPEQALGRTDAEWWTEHRADIIAALSDKGLRIMSNAKRVWLAPEGEAKSG